MHLWESRRRQAQATAGDLCWREQSMRTRELSSWKEKSSINTVQQSTSVYSVYHSLFSNYSWLICFIFSFINCQVFVCLWVVLVDGVWGCRTYRIPYFTQWRMYLFAVQERNREDFEKKLKASNCIFHALSWHEFMASTFMYTECMLFVSCFQLSYSLSHFIKGPCLLVCNWYISAVGTLFLF